MTKRKANKKSASSINEIAGVDNFFKKENLRFIVGLLILLVALFMLLAFISYLFTGDADQSYLEDPIAASSSGQFSVSNYAGEFGAKTAYYWIHDCFGLSSFMIPVFLLFLSMKLMRAYKVRIWKWFLHCSILMIWFSIALAYFANGYFNQSFICPGGLHGIHTCQLIESRIGSPGLFFLLIATLIIYLIFLTDETVNVVRRLLNPQEYLKNKLKKEPSDVPVQDVDATNDIKKENEKPQFIDTADNTVDFDLGRGNSVGNNESDAPKGKKKDKTPEVTPEEDNSKENEDDPNSSPDDKMEISGGKEVTKADGNTLEPYDPKLDLEHYKYPTLDLLQKYAENGPSIDMEEQNANKDRIIQILRNFNVEISSIKATVGPTITLYEITPAQGVRISKIRNLEDDIALSLSALGIRIIAPIPGKGTIGIEVPNLKPRIVSMESILNSKKFQETTYDLPIALGKTITNEVFMVDLTKMPHLLVAGATGQGKSVGLNAIITSLLYKKHPAELKFVMVDPKKVEFSIYAPIVNHFLAKVPDDDDDPIITDVSKVIKTLKSLCQEMDNRYDLLKKAHVRNIKEYNEKFKKRLLNPNNGHCFMPYIVVIIDEFGDLIMTAGKEIELPIARIAQLARAVGIHMVIATQRPTTNIITGTIKANFPARMAFKVSAMIDSRTILDRPGANQLIGRGDMLFLSGGDPVRVQCAFVDTPEVERITDFVSKQQGYTSPYNLPEVAMDSDESGSSNDVDLKQLDALFDDAARLIVIHQQGSTSLIQRKFSIGYNRAGRLMDQLEKVGIVGPAQGGKPREVLIADELSLDSLLQGLR